MNNPQDKSDLLEEVNQPPVDWYDDLPPASETRPDGFSSWLARALVNELNQTVQDVNKIVYVLNEIEKLTSTRQTISGETIPSPLVEQITQVVKQNKLDETVREQLARLPNSTFKKTLEANLRHHWDTIKFRSSEVNQQIRDIIPQGAGAKIQTEEYRPEEPVPAPVYTAPTPPPVEVSPAEVPAQELLLDIFDEAGSDEILVVAEHPGLVPSSIQIALNHDILTITAHDFSQESYHKEALLPFAVVPDNFSQQYRNGVLEIRLKKLTQPQG